MTEEWKDIVGYEGYYKVSSNGRILNVRSGKLKTISTQIATTKKLPYQYVLLSKDGVPKRHFVHRLVMVAFIGPVPKNQVVKHKDDNPTNNNLSNLEYGTQQSNVRECYDKGRGFVDRDVLKSLSLKAAAKTRKAVIAIKDGKTLAFEGIREAARQLNLPSSSVDHQLKGRCKSVYGFQFQYR